MTCQTCHGTKVAVYSCCTGESVDNDFMICPSCGEHLGEEECQTCKGTGEVCDECGGTGLVEKTLGGGGWPEYEAECLCICQDLNKYI